MRSMRILNVTAQKPDSTGSGTFLAQTVAAEVAAGHEAAVVCGVDAGDAIGSLPAGVPVYDVRFRTPELPFHVCGMSDVMPYAATRYRDLTPRMAGRFERAFASAVDRAVEGFRPDLIVCHHLYLVCAIVRERAGSVPVAGVCHSTDLRQLASHGLERERIRDAVRRLDAIFALHNVQAAQIEDAFGVDRSRIRLCGTGYDRSVFNQGGAAIARRAGSFVYVGKISRRKGVESLVRAFGSVEPASAGAPPSLTLIGGCDPASTEYADIERAARACRWPVAFAGRLAPAGVARAYRSSEAFVLPSFSEGLPLVGIEALACGCKVLMSDLPGVREGMEGLLPRNPMRWVAPPAMRAEGQPDPGGLPAFEGRLARALSQALRAPAEPYDTASASWGAVVERILAPFSSEP